MKMNAADYTAWVLIVVGGLNWGLVGVFDYNLVDSLFGVDSTLSNVVYALVGLAAVYSLVSVLMKQSGSKATASGSNS